MGQIAVFWPRYGCRVNLQAVLHTKKTVRGHGYQVLDELTQALFLFDNFETIVGDMDTSIRDVEKIKHPKSGRASRDINKPPFQTW
jgi:hypothetical protein